MAKKLTWDDAADIGILLSESHPELDPLAFKPRLAHLLHFFHEARQLVE